MLSNRPYLLRAFYQWIIDSACTPLLVIDANHPGSKIPKDYVYDNGESVFNISPIAIRDLKMTNQTVEFRASYSGVISLISVPIKSVLAVYAEENGEGIFFDAEEEVPREEKAMIKEIKNGISSNAKVSNKSPLKSDKKRKVNHKKRVKK